MKHATLQAAYERVLARALRQDDPVASVRAATAQPDCSAALRRLLLAACAHETGLRMSALLSARLRFERLLQGSARASCAFADDAAAFARLFRRYHRSVAPSAHGPRAEAALFEGWLSASAAREVRIDR